MKTFSKLTIASLKEFLRDRTVVIITLLVPVFFIAFFGMAFGGMENGKYSVGLVTEDKSSLGEGLSRAFDEVPMLDISRGSRDDQLEALRKGKLRAVIVIPEGVSAAVSGGKFNLPVYYDASQTMSAQTILSIVRQVVGDLDRQMTGRASAIAVDTIPLQAQRLRDIDFLLPGILGMGLMWLGIFSALPLVRQRHTLVLKRYNATPLSKSRLVSAQVVSRLLISAVQAAIIIAVGRILFNVQNMGSWYLVGLLVILGTLVFVALGYVIAAIAKTEESANGLSQLVNFPLMFLSGTFFPIELMPSYLMPVIRALPLTYVADAFRQVMLNGAGLTTISTDLAVMVGWVVVCLGISVRFFRWT